ncbi:MAG: hypothetical protein F4X58_00465 [Chloroflexi bacterium]|nr:hypothetical protein [Chloroflexota bacterium]MYC00381.1 hypothetical protein [Chloroflexota bacterium]
MALDPIDLADLAERMLSGSRRDEATCRTAINRLYYACHLSARDRRYGLDAHIAAGRRPSHQAILHVVQEQAGAERARVLEDLKRMREVSDYILDSDHSEIRAVFARAGASDWSDLADVAVAITRRLLPFLQAIPAVQPQDA